MKSPIKNNPFASLRARLMILVLTVILPLLGLIAYNDYEEISQKRLSVLNESLRQAQNASLIYSQLITEARQTLFILSQMPEFQQQDREACSKILTSVLKQSEGLTNLTAIKLNGDVIASAIASAKPINYSDREWFKRLVQTRSFVIGEYLIGRITGKPTLTFAYPILNSTGQLRTILALGLDLDRIGKKMADIHLPEGATLTVIDSNDTIILRFPDPEKLVGKSMPEKPIVKAILTQKEGVQEGIGVDGVRRLNGFTTIGSGIGAIHVIVSTQEEVAYAEVRRETVRSFVLVGLVGVLALLGAWLFGRVLIISPVKRLLNFTKRVAEGDLTVRTGQSNVSGEFDLLAHNFDRMAESLQRREEERKQGEQALRVSEENFRRSLDESPLGVRVVSKEGETLYVNRATLDIFGYDSIEEWQTTPTAKRYTEQSYAEFKVRREKRRLDADVSPEYEIDIVIKDGEVRHLQVWRTRVFSGMARNIIRSSTATSPSSNGRRRNENDCSKRGRPVTMSCKGFLAVW